MKWLAALALAGCGRVAFDPRVTGDGGAGDDGMDAGPQTYRDLVVSNGPLAYWRLTPFQPTVVDEMGSFPGVMSGTCSDVTGLLQKDTNRAMGFDGATCMIDVTGLAGRFAGTQAFSIEAWVWWSNGDVSGNFEHIFTSEERSSGPRNGIALVYEEIAPKGIFTERVANTATIDTAATNQPLLAGTNTHAVATYDGTTLKLYLQGVLTGSAADQTVIPAYPDHAFIGAGPDTGGINFFAGVIDEVAVYDYALSQSQVMQHYQFGTNPP